MQKPIINPEWYTVFVKYTSHPKNEIPYSTHESMKEAMFMLETLAEADEILTVRIQHG